MPGPNLTTQDQGVFIRYNWLGRGSFGLPIVDSANGDVLAHEIGHYLGLLHPFEGGCAGLNSTDCYTSGDYCCDVPAENNASHYCNYGPYNTCNEKYDKDPPDQKENYMGYSFPSCKTTFTSDQTKLMYARLKQYRPKLGMPSTIIDTSLNPCFLVAHIESEYIANCKNQPLKFQTYKVPSAVYTWKIFKGSILDTQIVSNFNELVIGRDTGTYSLFLEVEVNNVRVVDSLKNEIIFYDCGNKTPSIHANWYFGKYIGLAFGNNKNYFDRGLVTNQRPVQLYNTEGVAGISDSVGNLKFYAGADIQGTISLNTQLHFFGKNYEKLIGDEIIANSSNSQGPLILPLSDSVGIYKVFYALTGFPYFSFAKINTNIYKYNSIISDTSYGTVHKIGDVYLPDSATEPRSVGESLTAVPKCNRKDYWLFVDQVFGLNDNLNNFDKFDVYSVTNDSVKFVKKVYSENLYYANQIVFNRLGNYFTYGKKIYSFDKSNAEIVEFKNLASDSCAFTWNTCWSPNGKILYRVEYNGFDENLGKDVHGIYQYDVESNELNLGRRFISECGSERMMQLGPDGAIYIATNQQRYLSKIKYPDNFNYNNANECKYEPIGFDFSFETDALSYSGSIPNILIAEVENDKNSNFLVKHHSCDSIELTPEACCASSYLWDFGDGNFSSEKHVKHTFSDTGVYEIKLKINGTDSTIKQIRIGIPQTHKIPVGYDSMSIYNNPVDFTGPDMITYPNYIYTWSIVNGQVLDASGNRLNCMLDSGISVVKLNLKNLHTGCIDSGFKNVYISKPFQNNEIFSSQLKCAATYFDTIFGNSIDSILNANTIWRYKNIDSSFWDIVQNQTNSHFLVPIKDGKNYKYVRQISVNQCESFSNEVELVNFSDQIKIRTRDSACFNIFELDQLNFPSIKYQWQKSLNGQSFQNLTNDTFSSLIINKNNEAIYLRLKIDIANCTVFSDTLQHKSLINILKQPENDYVCSGIPFVLEVITDSINSYGFQWEYRKYLHENNWTKIRYRNQNLFSANLNFVSLSDWPLEFRVQIFNNCGSRYSDSVIVSDNVAFNGKFVGKDSTVISNNDSIFLDSKWTGNKKSTHLVCLRSKTPEGSNWDTLGITYLDSFKVLPNITDCQRKEYFKFALRDVCYYNDLLDRYLYEQYKIIEVVDSVTTPKSDLWLPDSYRDNGIEPNHADSNSFTGSLALWNRIPQRKGIRVWDWLDRENVQTDRDTNFIHAMIYNRGNLPESNGKINFYWTVMSTNEDWPYSWTGLAKFKHLDSTRGHLNKTFPTGGRINKTPISLSTFLNQTPLLPNHSPYNGELQPGDSILIEYPWTQADTVPRPDWFYGKVNGVNRFAKEIGMCILARLIECDTPSFGMSYPEKISLGNYQNTKKYRGNIKYNVTFNNNIVSENFYLGYMSPANTDTTQVWSIGMLASQGVDSISTGEVIFDLCADQIQYFNNAEVLVSINDDFWSILDLNNFPGNGYTVVPNSHQIIINTLCSRIGPVTVSDSLPIMLGFSWRYLPGSNPTGSNLNSLFTLNQFSDNILTGVTQFGIKSKTNFQNGGENTPNRLNDDSQPDDSFLNQNLKVNPNPFSEYLEISYNGQANSRVNLNLYDISGKIIKEIGEFDLDNDGLLNIKLNTENLSKGVYLLRVIDNYDNIVEKVIKY